MVFTVLIIKGGGGWGNALWKVCSYWEYTFIICSVCVQSSQVGKSAFGICITNIIVLIVNSKWDVLTKHSECKKV